MLELNRKLVGEKKMNQEPRNRIQETLNLNNWVSSMNEADESYNRRVLQRPTYEPTSRRVHESVNSFKPDTSVVNHVNQIRSDQANEAAMQNVQLGCLIL